MKSMGRTTHHQNRKYKVVSLFSGAGGMDAGLERTGRFITVACAELEKSFCDTLRANRDALGAALIW